jgi:adenosylhomocysteine nucleosidase
VNILVTFALETECSPWRKLRRFEREGAGTYGTVIGGAEVRVVVTGMGDESARGAVGRALAQRPDICISSGLAGGLRPQYAVGDVFAARTVLQAPGGRVMRSDAALLQASQRAGARTAATLCTAQRMLVTAAEKRDLGTDADAVDMESFSIMDEAAQRGIPAVTIRAISDVAGEDLPMDFNTVLDARGGIRYGRLAARLLRSPQRLPAMLRLGKASRGAAETLSRFLDSYISDLHDVWQPAIAARPTAAAAL